MLWLIASFLLLLYLLNLTRKPKHFPPGPPKLPIVGSLPFILGDSKEASIFHGARQLVEKYGKVAGFYLGAEPVVVLSDFNQAKEVLKLEEASDRPSIYPFNEAMCGHDTPGLDGRGLGILFSQGKMWSEQRRFVMRNLRDLGFGKSSMNDMLQEEVEKLLQKFKRKAGESMDLCGTLNISILNSLWMIMVGERLELDDPRLQKIVDASNDLSRSVNPHSPLSLVLPHPSMMKWPVLRDLAGLTKVEEVFGKLNSMMLQYRNDHLKSMTPGCPRDLLDILLERVQGTTDETSSFYGKMGMDSIIVNGADLFGAGMETVSSSLIWTFLYLMHFPKVQDRVYQEIIQVVGRDRLPSLDDQDQLHFTNAVLAESFRKTSFVFLGIAHYTAKPIQLQKDCVIPANCTIMANLYHIMHDPEYWKNPELFNPDRFIDHNGCFKKDERVIPFSVGKRFCMGQSLAEKEFFLFFAGIVQRFRMNPDPRKTLPDFGEKATDPRGGLRSPPQFHVVLKLRE